MTIIIPQPNFPDSCFESLWLMCPNKIGTGVSRDVYEIPGENKVLKVSKTQSNFANWTEIITYQTYESSGELAEVVSWSWSGKYLVMEKLQPVPSGYDMGTHDFPTFLTDRKRENYGVDASDRIKALDYGTLKTSSNTKSTYE